MKNGFRGRRFRPDHRRGGRVGGVRERLLEKRCFGRVEQQLYVVPSQDVQLPETEREPHPHTRAWRAGGEQRVRSNQGKINRGDTEIKSESAAAAPDEAQGG